MLNAAIKAWSDPVSWLIRARADAPVLFCAPSVLHATAQSFLTGFPGLVTYAVKANPDETVLTNLLAAGITAFDVASPNEIALMRRLGGAVTLHYNNPVKSRAEIEFAFARGVRSFALDSVSELNRIKSIVPAKDCELSVRFKLAIKGGHYDFGSKFGLAPDQAGTLLRAVADAGYVPSLAFHPGTQCADPTVYARYIEAAARIASGSGVTLYRLNTGGGFPSGRGTDIPGLDAFFGEISSAAGAFGDDRPELLCEPGRAMVGPAFAFSVSIRAIRDNGDIFLNDGIYGGLSEFQYLTVNTDFEVFSATGLRRVAKTILHRTFGPTCDSADVLPTPLALPADIEEGDFILFHGMGAYVLGLNTTFNGYGAISQMSVNRLRR